jgi:D-alanyl-D-alanine dipeptidase
MAAFMAWVHRKLSQKNESVAVTLIALLLVVSFLAVVEVSNSPKRDSANGVQIQPIVPVSMNLSCFDTVTAIVEIVQDENCPTGLLSLGNSALQQITDSQSATTELHPVLIQRFNAAYLTAKRDGVNLYITSGFRTLTRQELLFENAVKKYGSESEAAKWVLPAPYSHHPQGLAIDVNYPRRSTRCEMVGAQWFEIWTLSGLRQ